MGISSHDHRDAHFRYEQRVRGASPPLMRAASPSAPPAMYVFIGGLVSDWFLAHLRRFLGIDLFPAGRTLHWVRFPHSAAELAEIKAMVERGQLRPWIQDAARLPFSEAGVRAAFEMLQSRRTLGKIVLEMDYR